MNINGHRGSRPAVKRTAKELDLDCKLGLARQKTWRAEQAAGRESANGAAVLARAPALRKHKANIGSGFAEAIARAEFGRFYWNGELDSQLRSALQSRPKNGGSRRDASRRNGK